MVKPKRYFEKLKAQFLSSLGDAYHANQQHEKSDEYFELSLELDPDNFYVLNNYFVFILCIGCKAIQVIYCGFCNIPQCRLR